MRTELDIRCYERPNAVADNESNRIDIALLGARHDDFRRRQHRQGKIGDVAG
jgi:hypothetical protein